MAVGQGLTNIGEKNGDVFGVRPKKKKIDVFVQEKNKKYLNF